MDIFEKVEKLVQKSGCTYEEAKNALAETGGDLLEAMILLEQQGKAAPRGGSYSTRYESQPQYVPVIVEDKKSERERAGAGAKGEGGQKFKEFLKKVWHVLSSNYLVINRRGEQMAKLPFWVALLILFGSWFLILVLIVVSLFFGFTYSFEGEKEREMKAANEVMDKFSRAAESAKEEFRKK
ncbi:MAG: hypothetical protein J5493_05015 [Lachnospiraceae bacterium]|nr:hypothetical protein [Lachnospiraceae bacterium]